MNRIVIVGAGPQGRVVLQTLRAEGRFDVLGFLDDRRELHGRRVDGVPVLGGLDWAVRDAPAGLAIAVAVGRNDARRSISGRIRGLGLPLPNVIHPSAVVMPGTDFGTGNLICAGAMVVTGSRLAEDVVVNTGATLDHDCAVGSGAYLAPGVRTAGGVTIGPGAFIGLSALLGPGVTIGPEAVVGAGSLVLVDIPGRTLALGAPARVARALPDDVDWSRILAGHRR